MIPESGGRFSEKITLQPNIEIVRFNRIGSWSGGVRAFVQRSVSAFADFAAHAGSKQLRAVWAPWAMIALKGVAVVAILLYLGMAAILYFTQRSMMYFPETLRT